MIYKILGYIRHFAAAEYWRARALKAEAQLVAETWRNRFREDSLVNVPMRSAGMWPIPPRVGPAQPPEQRLPPPPSDPVTAFHNLSAIEKMEFQTQWLPDAEAAGVPLSAARQRFVEELSKRKSLNDEYPM